MEAKLIKNKYGDDFYYLMVGIDTYATTHKESFRILSLKNCQAIECGYDLDELIEEAIIQVVDKNEQVGLFDIGFLKGFLKALKILGDKKYSEEDMIKCFNASMDDGWVRADFYIQSLQQTEWDVEIVTHAKENGSYTKEDGFEQEPKLDADSCLILKRK